MKLKNLSFCVLFNILIIELLEVQLNFNLFSFFFKSYILIQLVYACVRLSVEVLKLRSRLSVCPSIEVLKHRARSCPSVRGFLSVCLSKQISTSNYLEPNDPLKFFHTFKLGALFNSANFQIPGTDGSEFFKCTNPTGI